MKICTKCKKEMICIKTGKIAVFNQSHCYAGDEFECKECGATILVCSEQSYYNENIRESKAMKEGLVIDMEN